MRILCDKNEMEILERRGVNNLCHFTHYKNIEKIITEGIRPLQLIKTETTRNDYFSKKSINENHISLSIEYPSYMFLNSLIKKSGEVYAILIIDIEFLADKWVHIFKSNPAIPRWGDAKSIEDLYFEEFRQFGLSSRYPTDPRAEVRVEVPIVPSFIKSVIYPTQLKDAFSKVNKQKSELSMEINDSWFKPRTDSDHWLKIREKGQDIFPLG